MLQDDLKEYRQERPEGIIESAGACKFCGQIRQIEAIGDWKVDDLDEAVTELCDCYEARSYTQKKSRKEKAKKSIDAQFGDLDQDALKVMHKNAEMIIEREFDSVAIGFNRTTKCKMSMTSKGNLQIKRIKTLETTKEV